MSYSAFLKSLIKDYNKQPSSLASMIMAVTDYESEGLVYFKLQSSGSFWAIRENDEIFWLTPKSKFDMNQFSFDALQVFFECRNHRENSIKKFSLIRPAKLQRISNSDNLQYKEKGILDFGEVSGKRLTDLEYWVSETEDVLFQSLLQKVSTEFNNSIKEDLEAVKLSLAQLESRQDTQNEEDFLLDMDWLEPIENTKDSENESLALLKNELQQNLENSIANLQDKFFTEINESKNSYNVLIEDLRRSQLDLEKRIRDQTQTVFNKLLQNSADIKEFQVEVENSLTESKNTFESKLKEQTQAINHELQQKFNEMLKKLVEYIDKSTKKSESNSKTNNQLQELGALPPLPPKRQPLPPKSNHTSSHQSSEIIQKSSPNLISSVIPQTPTELPDIEKSHLIPHIYISPDVNSTSRFGEVSERDLDEGIIQFIQFFNHSSNAFITSCRNYWKRVAEDKDSFVGRYQGELGQGMCFSEHPSGGFLAVQSPSINFNSNTYWLFPKPDESPNGYNMEIWEICFGYDKSKYNHKQCLKKQLIYPAKLIRMENKPRFEMVASGKINFI